MYRTYLANSKFVSASSAPHIAFMQTCAIELWGLDLQVCLPGMRYVVSCCSLCTPNVRIACMQPCTVNLRGLVLQTRLSGV